MRESVCVSECERECVCVCVRERVCLSVSKVCVSERLLTPFIQNYLRVRKFKLLTTYITNK